MRSRRGTQREKRGFDEGSISERGNGRQNKGRSRNSGSSVAYFGSGGLQSGHIINPSGSLLLCFHRFKPKNSSALSIKENRKAEQRSSAAAKPVAPVWMVPPLFSFSFLSWKLNIGSFLREVFKGCMQTALSIRKTFRKDLH